MAWPAEVELEEVDPAEPGLRRVRRGRSVCYLDPAGGTVCDEEVLERIRALAIPPAWRDVWISTRPDGHIQALGTDAAGRRQYLYHPEWRRLRDQQKFVRMEAFAAGLPQLRARVDAALATRGSGRDRVLACAVRLLDRGFFRVGGDEYAAENHTFGLATLERRHLRLGPLGQLEFDYLAKGGKRRQLRIVDPVAAQVLGPLRRRRTGTRLLACRESRRDAWVELRSADINAWLKLQAGPDFTAKDFRTWHATVLAALAVAVLGAGVDTPARRARAAALACTEVARYLGNTPAVCRASYIDPRVLARFGEGRTIAAAAARFHGFETGDPDALQGDVERAVLELLAGPFPAPAAGERARRTAVE